MKIWIVEVGEPLPLERYNNRPYRYSQLFDKLSSRGHDVIWWASNFSHQHKEKIVTDSDEIAFGANKSIRLINMPAYKSNLSVMRVVSQAITGVRFYRAISKENPPDLIVSAYPVIEMAFFSVFFSYKKRIPVIVDVQDLWPDIFVGIKSFFKKMLVSTFIYPFRLLAKYTFRNASGIVGVSRDYMEFGLKYSDRTISDNDAIFPLAYAKDNNISIIGSVQETIESNKTIIWFVGSFGSTYDLSTVVKTASNFEANGIDDVVFVITGDGDSFATIKNESYGLKNVILTGWLSLPQINYIGENASIGLMTYSEGAPQGLPNKVIEYMSFGLPMVCSLTGESMDLIASRAIGCQYVAGDADSLQSGIAKLLDKQVRKSMSQRAQQLFETEYSSEIVYDKYCNYIESFSSFSGR